MDRQILQVGYGSVVASCYLNGSSTARLFDLHNQHNMLVALTASVYSGNVSLSTPTLLGIHVTEIRWS